MYTGEELTIGPVKFVKEGIQIGGGVFHTGAALFLA